MLKFYKQLSWALFVSVLGILVFTLTVGATELTPPYVIAIKDMGASRPRGVAVDPITEYSYVLNQQGEVWIFQEQEIVATISVGNSPNIGVDPDRYVYVSSLVGDPIRVLKDTQLIGTVNVNNQPSSAIAVLTSTTPHYAYVTLPYHNAVAILNGTQIVKAALDVGVNPTAIAANPATGLVYVANSGSNNVSVIQNNNVVATVTVGITPTAVAVNPQNGYVYVSNGWEDTVSILSGTAVISSAIPVGVAPQDIAVNPNTGHVYVVNTGFGSDPGSVSILSGTQWLTNTYTGPNPRSVDVNPQTNYIYIAGGVDIEGTVAVLSDTLNGALVVETFLPVGHSPNDIAVNPATDLAYASLYKSSGGDTGQVVIMGRTEASMIILYEGDNTPTQLDTGNPNVTIAIPGDAVSETITLLYTDWEPDTNPLVFAKPGFILKAYNILGVHQPLYQFKKPLSLRLESPQHEDDLMLRTGRSGGGHRDWVTHGTDGIIHQTLGPSLSVVTATIKTLPEYSHAGYALTTSHRRIYMSIILKAYP